MGAEEILLKDISGKDVPAILSVPKDSDSIIIMSHGFTSNKDSSLYRKLEKDLYDMGISSLRYDYYGHGPSYFKGEGYGLLKDVTLTKTLNSLRSAVTFAKSYGGGRFEKLGLLGASYGGLLSILMAGDDEDIDLLVLKSPVTDLKGFWESRIKEKKFSKNEWMEKGIFHYDNTPEGGVENYDLEFNFWLDIQDYDAIESAKLIKCPVFIVHGTDDIVVPIEYSRKLAGLINAELVEIEGCDHAYSKREHNDLSKKLIVDFVKKNF